MTFSLEEVADRLAIYDLYARYVHAVDEQDFAVLDRIFMPDTMFDWTEAGHKKGDYQSFARDDIMSHEKIFPLDFHVCGNIRIDFNADRTAAKIKSKTLNASGMRGPDGSLNLIQVHGGYSDELVKMAEGWRFKSRIWNHGWVSGGTQVVGDAGAILAGD